MKLARRGCLVCSCPYGVQSAAGALMSSTLVFVRRMNIRIYEAKQMIVMTNTAKYYDMLVQIFMLHNYIILYGREIVYEVETIEELYEKCTPFCDKTTKNTKDDH